MAKRIKKEKKEGTVPSSSDLLAHLKSQLKAEFQHLSTNDLKRNRLKIENAQALIVDEFEELKNTAERLDSQADTLRITTEVIDEILASRE